MPEQEKQPYYGSAEVEEAEAEATNEETEDSQPAPPPKKNAVRKPPKKNAVRKPPKKKAKSESEAAKEAEAKEKARKAEDKRIKRDLALRRKGKERIAFMSSQFAKLKKAVAERAQPPEQAKGVPVRRGRSAPKKEEEEER